MVRRVGNIGSVLLRIRRPRPAGRWLRRPLTARTTVAQWMSARGIGSRDIGRWGGAVGTVTARLARLAGYAPVKAFIVSSGGRYEEYVYPDTTFMDAAWTAPDAKGRTFAEKIG